MRGTYLRQSTAAKRDNSRDGSSDAPINLRENFNALAVFSPTVKTDSNGKAMVDVKLPDNLTRYRITAVAVDTGQAVRQERIDVSRPNSR